MGTQGTLFADLEPSPPDKPSGFRYQQDLLSPEEEAALATLLSSLDLQPFEFHGHVGNRRVASFGLQYDFDRRTVESTQTVPAFLVPLMEKAAEFAGCAPGLIRQVGINEYRPGAGIGWHVDKPQFGDVIGVSLLATATMRFRRSGESGWQRFSKVLAPRSAYLLSGEIRQAWQHSIVPTDQLRYSINLRTLAERP